MKKFIYIFMSVIIIFSATGCRGAKQQVEKLAVVLAMGFDLTPENKYIITVELINTQKSSSKDSQQSSSSEVMVFSSQGDTPNDAINRLSTDFGRDLYFGHSQYIVIGEYLAESGLSTLIDALLRSHEARPGNFLLLTKGKASDVMKFKPIDEAIPANSVRNLIKLQSLKGYSPAVSRLEFANALSSKTEAPIMGVINLNRENNPGSTFKLAGTGVFEKDKLIGYLTGNETRGMQWIKGKVKIGNVISPYSDGSKITFALLNGTSQIKPVVENDSITIQITIKAESNIIEMPDKLDPMKDPKIMDELANLQNEAIKKEARLALNAAQNRFNADIFDFGGLIHREYPETWKKLESNWNYIFPNLKVELNVNSTIKSPGIISKPIDNNKK